MESKDTFFSKKQSLSCRGQLIPTDHALIMGILNITPDSFYAGSRLNDPGRILETAARMIEEGADILDLGAYSSRPGASEVSQAEELRRLEPAFAPIREAFPGILLSVDTFRSAVARRAVRDFGADMVNDISGGDLDEGMFKTVAELGVPYVLMHMRGTPATMQQHAVYQDVTREIILDFSGKLKRLALLGVRDIILDPGFGFAKNIDQNFRILGELDAFRIFPQPLMVGVSRKSLVYKTLDISPREALNGTTVLHTIALMKGARILRVHDVGPAREAVRLVERMMKTGSVTT
jgi:dihydropteroate synthase